MSEHRYCRICGQRTSDEHWVYLEFLPGRFYLCSEHNEGARFVALDLDGFRAFAYHHHGQGPLLLIGPYPYESMTPDRGIREAT